MMLRRCLLLLGVLFSLHAVAQVNLFSQQQDFLPVEQAYQLHTELNSDKLTLVWQLADSYYLYQHGFAHQWLYEDGSKASVSVDLPAGVERYDEYFGDIVAYYQQVVLHLPLPDKTAILKASSQGCADAGLCYPPYHLYFEVDPDALTVKQVDKPSSAVQSRAFSDAVQGGDSVQFPSSLLFILFSAFVGGLILNLMPCVFPILSIKLLQLTQQYDAHTRRMHGLVYMLGVVLSFMAVAGVMLGLRSAGSAIGWGFQLQSPWFVAILVYLFFVLAAGMAGLVQLGQSVMAVGQSLTQGKGLSSAFFTGVLAVVVASPCTAPFMGAALGFAVSQSAFVALLVFAALGLGMAMPLTLLSSIPQWAKILPKPGLWMERLKQFFAFPLVLTAIWLLWVLGNQAGTLAMAVVLLGCLLLAFAYWCARGGLFSRIIAALSLVLALGLLFSSYLETSDRQKSSAFTPFSEQALAQLRSEGQPVFIDLTADWCITCIANEKTTLHTDDIQQAFAEAGIIYMVGDWTNYDEEITALLTRYQRSGIPLYLLFSAEVGAPPQILPQLLTKGIVRDAIKSM